MRRCMRAMESSAIEPFVESETPPPGMPNINADSSDAELDERIRALTWSWFHCAGTAAMGKVVDAECRVYGAEGLRVVDTSIMPISVTAHLQAPMYAVAEQAADMIAKSV